MEATSSEVIFESLNLSPQLFINDALNMIDEVLDEAFNFYLEDASALLKTEGTDREAELTKGVAHVQDLIQSTLDKRMQKWEEYCLRFCFSVPEGFSLPKASGLLGDDLPDLDALTDKELDVQLNSLRDKLALVGKETADLGRELRALERQSLSSSQSAGSIDEAVQLCLEHDASQMFHELTTMASEFRKKLGNLKRKRMDEIQPNRLHLGRDDVLRMPRDSGLFGVKLEELQEFVDEIIT